MTFDTGLRKHFFLSIQLISLHLLIQPFTSRTSSQVPMMFTNHQQQQPQPMGFHELPHYPRTDRT